MPWTLQSVTPQKLGLGFITRCHIQVCLLVTRLEHILFRNVQLFRRNQAVMRNHLLMIAAL